MLSLTENLTFGNFTLPFCGLRQRIATCAARFFVLVQPIRSLFSGVVAVGAVLAYVPYSQDATVAMSLSGFKQTATLSLSQTIPQRILLLPKKNFLFCLKREENTIFVDLDCKSPRILYFPPSEKSKTGLPGFWNPSRAFQPSSTEVLNSSRMCQYKARFCCPVCS